MLQLSYTTAVLLGVLVWMLLCQITDNVHTMYLVFLVYLLSYLFIKWYFLFTELESTVKYKS